MTATLETPLPDVDLDAVVPCDVDDCPTAATWQAITGCCSVPFGKCCDQHHDEAIERLEFVRRKFDSLVVFGCKFCAVKPAPFPAWRAL